jgi:hypothetical protein
LLPFSYPILLPFSNQNLIPFSNQTLLPFSSNLASISYPILLPFSNQTLIPLSYPILLPFSYSTLPSKIGWGWKQIFIWEMLTFCWISVIHIFDIWIIILSLS